VKTDLDKVYEFCDKRFVQSSYALECNAYNDVMSFIADLWEENKK